jgi:hypothetical protein
MMRITLVFLLGMTVYLTHAQSLEIWTSLDTVLLGNRVEVSYKAENVPCDLNPELNGLPVIAGPSTSSSVSIINGQRSSMRSLTVVLLPEEVGTIVLPGVSCDSITIEQREIIVVENPEGIKQQANARHSNPQIPKYMPTPPQRPKRRLRKI